MSRAQLQSIALGIVHGRFVEVTVDPTVQSVCRSQGGSAPIKDFPLSGLGRSGSVVNLGRMGSAVMRVMETLSCILIY